MIGISILGSTGSIGVSTLDVIARHPDKYRVVALTANSNVDKIYQQCLEFKPQCVAMADAGKAEILAARLKDEHSEIQVLSGINGLQQAAAHAEADQVMAAIVGAAGLLPTLAAVEKGKTMLLANKEALVVAGDLFIQAAAKSGAKVLPIDSEHNAIFQCMPNDYQGQGLPNAGIEKILLTASGGPFRQTSLVDLDKVTPEQACAHPNWDMGRKISVDSATMMNKGLEVIEACWLFNAKPEQIQVVVHPQSVVHSMVSYNDGSVLAQMGNPDMRTPIAHAMAWPDRIASGVAQLDIFQVAHLDFESPDFERFPCLKLCYQAIETGGTMPTILNAANEIAVEAFLNKQIRFTDIAAIIETTMRRLQAAEVESLAQLLDVDQQARAMAQAQVA